MILLIPLGNSLMNGFSEPTFRWTMFITFMNIGFFAQILENLHLINYSVLKKSAIMICSLLIFIIPLVCIINNIDVMRYSKLFMPIIVTLFLIVFAYYSIVQQKYNLLLVIIVVELGFALFNTINLNPALKSRDWEFVNKSDHVLGEYDELNTFLYQYVEGKDIPEFYRIYAPYKEVYYQTSFNQNLNYGFAGMSTYDSLYNIANSKLFDLGGLSSTGGWQFEVENRDLMDFVSMKYAVVTDESELPGDNFEFISYFNDNIQVYKNLDYMPIANTFHDVMSYHEYAKEGEIKDLKNYVVCDAKDLVDISNFVSQGKRSQATDIYKYQNGISFNIDSDTENFVVATIGYNKGWSIKVNGEATDYYDVNGGFIGFNIKEGQNYVEMYFMTKGFKFGAILSAFGILLLSIIGLYKFLKTQKKIVKI